MQYKGYFKSLKNKDYTVSIVTNHSTSLQKELVLGPEPFVTQMDESGDTIYSPVKYSSATVQIVSEGYEFDLYSNAILDVPVELKDTSTGEVYWTGFTQPNTYDVDYNFVLETYTLECVDGLAALKSMFYGASGVASTDEHGVKHYIKNFKTFKQIITDILDAPGCYEYWYFSTNTSIYNNQSNILLDATISEWNFFDEDDDPMTLAEVLEEICKFCGVTCVAEGKNVYFLDYDAIRHGNNEYYKFTVGSTSYTTTTKTHDKILYAKDYAASESTLTLDNTYSKVTVVDNLYAVEDSILPDIFDDADLINITSSNHYWNSALNTLGNYCTIDKSGFAEWWGARDTYKYFFASQKTYMSKDKWTHYFYNNSLGSTSTPASLDAASCKNYICCVPMRIHVVADKDTPAETKQGTLSYSDYLFIPNNKTDITNVELLETNDNYVPKFFLPGNCKFMFSGTVLYTCASYNNVKYRIKEATPTQDKMDNIAYAYTDYPYVPIEVDCGRASAATKDHQGAAEVGCAHSFYRHWEPHFGWIEDNKFIKDIWGNYTQENYNYLALPFKLSLGPLSLHQDNNWSRSWSSGDPGIVSVIAVMRRDSFPKTIADNVNVDMGIDGSGYVVDGPYFSEGKCIAATPHFTLCGPRAQFVHTHATWIKDFKLKCVIPNVLDDENKMKDTEYSYEISNSYENTLSDIDFKVCTWDGKSVNYSAVAVETSTPGTYDFIDKLHNNALGLNERSENIMCYKIANQYNTPSKKLRLTLFDTLHPWTLVSENVIYADMIVDCISRNYVNDSVTVNLIEKQ